MNYEEFLDYIPDATARRAEEIFAMLGGKKKVSEDILRMVESLLDEADYQKSYRITQHLKRWKDFHGAGPQDPGKSYPNKRPDYMVYRIKEEDIDERSKKYFGKKFYDIAMLHGDEMTEEELEETSTSGGGPGGGSGNVEGSATGRKNGKTSGPWHGLDTEEENKEQKKNSKIPHGRRLVEDDEFIEEVLNYLLNKSGANQ